MTAASAVDISAGPLAIVQVLLMQRSTIDGNKVARSSNYVLVTVGQRPPECLNAWASAPCSPGHTSAQEQRLLCSIQEVLQGFCANDRARACRCRNCVMSPESPDCASSAVCRKSISLGTDHTWPYWTKPRRKVHSRKIVEYCRKKMTVCSENFGEITRRSIVLETYTGGRCSVTGVVAGPSGASGPRSGADVCHDLRVGYAVALQGAATAAAASARRYYATHLAL